MKRSRGLDLAHAIEPAVRWYTRLFRHRGTGRLLKTFYDFEAYNHPVEARVPFLGKYTLEVDRSTYMGWYLYFYGTYNPETLRHVGRVLRPGGVAIDVGAGVGDFTVAMADAVGPSGTVHAFEPSPGEFGWLARNVSLNGLAQVKTHQAAVSDVSGSGVFECVYGVNPSRGTLADSHHETGTATVSCPVTAIDDLANGWNRFDLLKIDTQGADVRVLLGARAALNRHRPSIILNAVQEVLYKRFGTSIDELETLLKTMNYRMNWIARPGGHKKGVGIATPAPPV